MVQFKAVIKKFRDRGEKTGWSYIEIPAAIALQLKAGNKRSFRVRGRLDAYLIKAVSLLPMGNGDFILALNAAVRKKIRKEKGATVAVSIEEDTSPVELDKDLLECLADEPAALAFFNQLAPGHRKYFSNWIGSAKTEVTKSQRIAQAVNGLALHQDFGQMLRALKK